MCSWKKSSELSMVSMRFSTRAVSSVESSTMNPFSHNCPNSLGFSSLIVAGNIAAVLSSELLFPVRARNLSVIALYSSDFSSETYSKELYWLNFMAGLG